MGLILTEVPFTQELEEILNIMFQIVQNVIGCPLYSGSVIKFLCLNQNDQPDTSTNNDRYITNSALQKSSPALSSGTDELLFSGNQFLGNAAAYGGAILEIYNAFRISFINETYQYNGDSMCDSLQALSSTQFNNLVNCALLSMAQTNLVNVSSTLLIQSVIKIKNAKEINLSGIKFDSNWNLEINDNTLSRSQLLYAENVFGDINFQNVIVSNQNGLDNDFIDVDIKKMNQRLKYTNFTAYSCIYPLFTFSNSQFNFALTSSTFKSITFHQTIYSQSIVSKIFNFGRRPEDSDFQVTSFIFTDNNLSNIDCHMCTKSYMIISSEQIQIAASANNQNTFTSINSNVNATINNSPRLFELLMQRNQQVTINFVQAKTVQSSQEGSVFKIYDDPLDSATLINGWNSLTLSNSYFQSIASYLGSTGAGVIYIDLYNMNIYSENITIISASSTGAGGAFMILNTAQITMISYNVSTLTSTGEGEFLYISDSSSINTTIFINNSVFTCETNLVYNTTPNLTQNYYSLFYLQKQTTVGSFLMNLQTNQYLNCGRSSQGGIFQIQTIQNLNSFTDNGSIYQNIMTVGNGGAIFLSGASSLSVTATSISQIACNMNGGFIYCLKCNSQTFDFTMIKASQIFTSQSGGLAFIQSSISSVQQLKLQSDSLVSPFDSYIVNFQTLGNGVILYIDAQNLDLQMYSINISNIEGNHTTSIGGFLYHTSTSSSSQININLNYGVQQNINVAEAGFIYSNAKTQSLLLQGDQTNQLVFNQISAKNGDAGLLNLLGSSIQLQILYVTIQNINSLTSQGGCFKLIATASLNISVQNTQAQNILSLNDGGFTYLESQQIDVACNYCNFQNISSQSMSGGIFRVASGTGQSTYVSIQNSNFMLFSSNLSGSFIIIEDNTLGSTSITVENSTFECSQNNLWNNYTSNIVTKLASNTSTIGTVFYFNDNIQGTFTSQSNKFQNCYIGSDGGILRLSPKIIFTDTLSSFSNIAAIQGSILSCSGCQATFDSSQMLDGVANDGGFLYLIDGVNVLLKNVSLKNAKALGGDGGCIYAGLSNQTSPVYAKIMFQNCNNPMQYFESQTGDGGFFYIENQMLDLVTEGCYWNDLWAENRGGLIYGGKLSSFNLNDCQLENITSGGQGSFFYSISNQIQFKISNCQISCLDSYNSTYAQQGVSNLTSNIGGAFYFDSALNISSQNNEFKYCYVASSGSIFSLKNTQFYDTNSYYHDNAALQGGVIYCEDCYLNLLNVTFSNMLASQGGIIYGVDQVKMEISNVSVQNIQASQGGVIWTQVQNYSIDYSGYININNTILDNISVNSLTSADGGVLYISNEKLVITMDTITGNNINAVSSGGLIYGDYIGQVTIQNSQFSIISAQISGSIIYSSSQYLGLTIQNNIITCQSSFSTSNLIQQIQQNSTSIGSLIEVSNSNTEIISQNNQIQNCSLSLQGGILNLKSSKALDQNNVYLNIASINGAVYYCNFCQNLMINNNTFTNIYAQSGGLLYVEKTQGDNSTNQIIQFTQISCSNFIAYSTGGIVYVTSTYSYQIQMTISNSVFNQITAQEKGGLFYFSNQLLGFNSISNNFTNFKAEKSQVGSGGGFYIQKIGQIQVKNNIFINFSASLYGSLIYSVDSLAQISFNNSIILCQTNVYDQTNLSTNYLSSLNLIGGSSAIHMTQGSFISGYNSYSNCYFASQGGIFQLYGSTLNDQNSNFTLNSGYYGGVMFCDSCYSVLFQASSFEQNLGNNGGVIYSTFGSNLSIQACNFKNNTAYQDGGVLYASELSNTLFKGSFSLINNYFYGHIAQQNGGIFSINSFFVSLMNFSNNFIDYCSSEANGGVGYFGSNYMQLSYFSLNTAINISSKSEGSFIYSSGLNHQIELIHNNITCNYNVVARNLIFAQLSKSNFSNTIGGAFYITSASNVNSYINYIGYLYSFQNKDIQWTLRLSSKKIKLKAINGRRNQIQVALNFLPCSLRVLNFCFM